MTANLYIFGGLLVFVALRAVLEVLLIVLTIYEAYPPRPRPQPFWRVRMAATIARHWFRTTLRG